jgi:hypothetical protein
MTAATSGESITRPPAAELAREALDLATLAKAPGHEAVLLALTGIGYALLDVGVRLGRVSDQPAAVAAAVDAVAAAVTAAASRPEARDGS